LLQRAARTGHIERYALRFCAGKKPAKSYREAVCIANGCKEEATWEIEQQPFCPGGLIVLRKDSPPLTGSSKEPVSDEIMGPGSLMQSPGFPYNILIRP